MSKPATPQESGYEALALAEVQRFVENPAFDQLAGLFGVEELPTELPERMLAIQKIAVEHWDFRKGAERQAVDWNDALLDQEGTPQWDVVFEAADALGLVQDTEPTITHPAYLVILGGANQAPYNRLKYGLEKTTGFGTGVYLGSSRPVKDAEREKAAGYAPDAQTEFDLGCGAVETLLGATIAGEVKSTRDGDTWITRVYEYTDESGANRQFYVLNTPHTIRENRATTYDNYDTFIDAAEIPEHPGATVVAVTTGFYTQGQKYPAVQKLTLPYGAHVETIGHSAEYAGGVRKPSQLLQETKAGVDAAVRLYTEIDR